MEAVLEAVKRDRFGKNEAGRMRREGRLPGVLYGGNATRDAVPIAVEPKALSRILHSETGANTLITLRLEGESPRVMVKEFQLDPVTHQLLHADFYRVAMDKLITVTVPVTLKGEAPGVKQQGGLIDFVHRDIDLECLPADIPEAIVVDVTELMLYDGIRVRDLQTGGKWKALSDQDLLIVHLVAPKTEAEPAPAEAAAAPTAPAEPEVIKKGKVEKEED